MAERYCPDIERYGGGLLLQGSCRLGLMYDPGIELAQDFEGRSLCCDVMERPFQASIGEARRGGWDGVQMAARS